MPLPAVSVPWQLAHVPSPGAPVLGNGGLVPNEYTMTGTDSTAPILPSSSAVFFRLDSMLFLKSICTPFFKT
jgi:hypothetical protein